jgi:hypothetical protein
VSSRSISRTQNRYHAYRCGICGTCVSDTGNFHSHLNRRLAKKRRAELASAADQLRARSTTGRCYAQETLSWAALKRGVPGSSAHVGAFKLPGFMQDDSLASGSSPCTARHASPVVPINADPRRGSAGAAGRASEDQGGHRACASQAPQHASDEMSLGTPVLAAPHDVGELRPGSVEATATQTAFGDTMRVDGEPEPSPQLHPRAPSPNPPTSVNCFPDGASAGG